MNLDNPINIVKHHQDLFQWCLRGAHQCIRAKHYIKAARWCESASLVGDYGEIGALASNELENMLLELSKHIPATSSFEIPQLNNKRERWLHVLTEAYPVGGHTTLVTRWIEHDSDNASHSVVLTNYQAKLNVPNLQQAILNSEGQSYSLGQEWSPWLRASALRNLVSKAEVDVVVLHIHMADIVPTLALGVPGKTPILFLNHADHTFWVGGSIADTVLNIRPSGEDVTKTYRGIQRNFLLPLPLYYEKHTKNTILDCTILRRKMRDYYQIPQSARVLLTIGSEYKYESAKEPSFQQTALKIIRQVPNTYVVAVGPTPENAAWANVENDSDGRVIAVGIQQDLHPFHVMADIYGEGFPFGSLTALLEAGLSGLPCVLAPMESPPIFWSSDLSTQNLASPRDINEYISTVCSLLTLSEEKLRGLGEKMATQVLSHHCKEGWRNRLIELRRQLPQKHQIYPLQNTPHLPQEYIEHALKPSARCDRKYLSLLVEKRAYEFGLTLPDSEGLWVTPHSTAPSFPQTPIWSKLYRNISSLTRYLGLGKSDLD